MSTGCQQGLILSVSRLHLGIGTRPRMTKLHLRGEHLGTCSNTPRDDWLEETTTLDGITESILLYATNL